MPSYVSLLLVLLYHLSKINAKKKKTSSYIEMNNTYKPFSEPSKEINDINKELQIKMPKEDLNNNIKTTTEKINNLF